MPSPGRWFLALVVMAAVACDSTRPPVGPDLGSLQITPSRVTVAVGSSTVLVATATNGQGEVTADSVVWSSSDPTIATVDDGGVVIGLRPGIAIVTARSGNRSGSAEVTVFGVTTPELPGAVVGAVYGASLEAVGVAGSYAWTLSSGSLPPGLEMADDGALTGTPDVDGPFRFVVEVESAGLRASREVRLIVYQSVALKDFLESLDWMIQTSIEANTESLERNPHLAGAIEEKNALLSEPGLADSILAGRFFSEAAVESVDGRSVPSVIVFPADSMRAGALDDLRRSGSAIRVLEEFLGVPWPTGWVRNWYGFRLGHGGGGGTLYMEDRGTYAARGGGTLFALHDGILAHELAHSYVGHEWITQFLHLYVHNLIETGSQDTSEWVYFNLEDYEPFKADNTRWRALLDIYRLLGPTLMGEAVRELHLMGVPYGSALSDQARQVFVDKAPADERGRVAELVTRIG